MPKFRKKPVVIEAAKWLKNGDHPDDYREDRYDLSSTYTGAFQREAGWEGQIVRYFRRPDIDGEAPCRECGVRMHEHGWIDTREGGHIVCPGDWILTGVKGERYPCKPEIFVETYDPVEETVF